MLEVFFPDHAPIIPHHDLRVKGQIGGRVSKAIRNGNIFCLESLWSDSTDHPRQSVLPLLDTLQRAYDIRLTHLNCNTKDEFFYNLGLSKGNYGIIYISTHGESTKIKLHSGDIDLEELSIRMGRKFKNCGIHFASCSTLKTDKKNLEDFVQKTGVSFVSGYKKDVYWIPSAAVDLVYLDYLIDDIAHPEKAVLKMKKMLNPSNKELGFTFFGG